MAVPITPDNPFIAASDAAERARAIPPEREAALREVSQALEATFLAEMLRHTGVAKPPDGFGGGAGESAFASFLSDAYATELSRKGGIGLSEAIFRSLAARETGS